MKTLEKHGRIDSARMAVLIGLSIGLGLAVHEGFFLVTAMLVIGALAAMAIHAIREHHDQNQLAYRAR